MKTAIKILLGLLFVIALLIISVNSIVQKVIRESVLNTTGFDIEIGRLHIGLLEPVVEVSRARLINPEDFPEATAMEIKRLRVIYDRKSLWTPEIHLREIVVDVPLAVLLIREDGESNLSRLGKQVAKRAKGETEEKKKEEAETPAPEKEATTRKLRVDLLTLKLDRVEVRRYEVGAGRPEVREFQIGLNRTATNVTDLGTVNAMIIGGLIEGIGTEALRSLGRVFRSHEQSAGTASDVLEKAAEKLSDRLRTGWGRVGQNQAARD